MTRFTTITFLACIAFWPATAVAIDEDCVSSGCHGDFGEAEFVHEAMDYCGDCHAATEEGAHKKNVKNGASTEDDFEMMGEVPTLCFDCHDSHAEVTDNLHPPYEDGECLECHSPHQSGHEYQLLRPIKDTCFYCHDGMMEDLESVRVQHDALDEEGSCVNCHNPHGADPEYFLQSEPVSKLCGAECHSDIVEWTDSVPEDHRHGPIQDGECQACHNPHGSNYSKLLRGRYPDQFYAPWNANNYRACFGECHDPKKFAQKAFSSFGNKDKNLHALHVNRSKGRTCRFCHEPHASRQEHLLRTSVPFGLWAFEMKWQHEGDGKASCSPACHEKKTYDKAAPLTPKADEAEEEDED